MGADKKRAWLEPHICVYTQTHTYENMYGLIPRFKSQIIIFKHILILDKNIQQIKHFNCNQLWNKICCPNSFELFIYFRYFLITLLLIKAIEYQIPLRRK